MELSNNSLSTENCLGIVTCILDKYDMKYLSFKIKLLILLTAYLWWMNSAAGKSVKLCKLCGKTCDCLSCQK